MMFVDQFARNIKNIRVALATVATLLQLTSYRYPLHETVTDGATYDYIVVGAGTAGAVVANRLSEDPNASILLIEARGDPPMESNLPGLHVYTLKSRWDWNFTSQADSEIFECIQNNRLFMNSGKALGGSTTINHLFYVRGDPKDYDTWAEITGDQSWNYNNVLKYFIKSERLEDSSIIHSPYGKYHGTDGYMGLTKLNFSAAEKYLDSFKELGYDIVLDTNGNNSLGFTQHMVIAADGLRESTANAFLSSIKERNNLHVMKDSLVTKIIIDEDNIARGVAATDKSGDKIKVYANKEVILSAGAINSPKLLMLSGIGPKDKLEELEVEVKANLPVGEKLQTHTPVILSFKMLKSASEADQSPLDPKDFPFPTITGLVALNSTQTYPDYQIIGLGIDAEAVVALCYDLFSFNKDICQHFYNETEAKDALFIVLTSCEPTPHGQISLKSLDPEEPPLIHMNAFPRETDVDKYVSYIEDLNRLVNTTYFKSVKGELVTLPKCKDFTVGSRDYWKCYMGCLSTTSMHYTATCPMGSVVDSRLRVRGVSNLRVADASVMPSITSGNTMAPALMIGEKAADMIKEDNAN